MKTIRLLHLMKSFDIGGVERSTITYSNQLTTLIESVAIFAKEGRLNHSNIVNKNVSMFYTIGKISNPFTSLFNLIKIIAIIFKTNINVIHYHHRIYVPFIRIIKLLFPSVKIIYTHHSVFHDDKNKLIFADLKIAISESTRNDLAKYLKSNIKLIPHGIELIPNKIIDHEINTIGYVGRFHESKGIFTLLKAFKSLVTQKNGIKLVLYGEGDQFEKILNFIHTNNLQKEITICPPTIDLQCIYKNIDLLIVPSINLEGFGLVIIEAMSFSIPVIASDLESFKEVIIHEATGLIFENNNIESLKENIVRIIDDQNLRKKITSKAIGLIRTNFDANNYIKHYLDEVKRLLENN